MLAGRLTAHAGVGTQGREADERRSALRVVRDDNLRFEDLPQDYAGETRRFLDFSPWIDVMLGRAAVHGEGDAVRGGRERPGGLHVARGERRSGVHRVFSRVVESRGGEAHPGAIRCSIDR